MVNYLAVLVATIAAFIVGALWYGPLFGKPWRRMMGVAEGSDMSGLVRAMVGGFIATFVMVYVYDVFRVALGVVTPAQAAWLAALLVIGFVATTMLNSVFYEKRPVKLYLINVSHYLVALIVAALVLAWW